MGTHFVRYSSVRLNRLPTLLLSLAATVFQHLVAADDASETLASVKRIHGLVPYMLLKGALKISNPIAMIRSTSRSFIPHLRLLTDQQACWIYFSRNLLEVQVYSSGGFSVHQN